MKKIRNWHWMRMKWGIWKWSRRLPVDGRAVAWLNFNSSSSHPRGGGFEIMDQSTRKSYWIELELELAPDGGSGAHHVTGRPPPGLSNIDNNNNSHVLVVNHRMAPESG